MVRPAFFADDSVVDERQRLKAGDFERLAAADIGTGQLIVPAHHVRLRFSKLRPVALIGVPGELGPLAADNPGHLVIVGLSALGADKVVGALFCTLCKEIPLKSLLSSLLD